MYEADPFSARQKVDARQAKASERSAQHDSNAESSSSKSSGPASSEFSQAPEVRMASGLRELVEDAIRKASRDVNTFQVPMFIFWQGISLYPEATDLLPSVISQEDAPNLIKQLATLGFTPVQARNAVQFLSVSSPVTANLLGSLPPLEACIEYLILHVPECDLPKRFLPDSNSSNPFITSAHSGADDLKKRWIENKAVKEAGWPPLVVKECVSDARLVQNWNFLLVALGKRLLGQRIEDVFTSPVPTLAPFDISVEEYEALGAHFEEPFHLVMPLFSAPLTLHVFTSSDEGYPRPGAAPMYLTSPSIPPYVRLHLLSRLLSAVESVDFLQPGEGFCMAAMRVLEGEWALIEDNGPPEMSMVLQYLISSAPEEPELETEVTGSVSTYRRRKRMGDSSSRPDDRTDDQIRKNFESMLSKQEVGANLSPQCLL